MKTIKIKKFSEYQHYHNRGIKWIKLYLTLLDDIEFWKLEDWEKWLWVGLLLLGGKFNNTIPYDEDFLRSKLSIKTPKLILDTIKKFVVCGFIDIIDDNGEIVKQIDSNLIAQKRIDKKRIDKKDPIVGQAQPQIPFPDYCKEIIEYLNTKTGKKYDHTAEAHTQYLKTLYKRNIPAKDCKLVILWKYTQWQNEDNENKRTGKLDEGALGMSQYVRVSTLFCRKHFDEYLVEAIQQKEIQNKNL
jgi:uncharacterized phage protein (TIGR02220 family)